MASGTTLGKLVWEISGDTSGFDKAYGKTDKQTTNLAKSFKQAEIKASLFGNKTTELKEKQGLLQKQIVSLIEKGVNPANKGFKKLTDQYNSNQKELDKLSQKSSSTGMLLKTALAGAAIYALNKFRQFFNESTQLASDSQETIQKFGNVFTSTLPQAQEYARQVRDNANVSLTEAKAMLAMGGAVLKSSGMQEEAALQQSKVLAKMAGDLKSFHNLTESTEDVMMRLVKATLGEREGLIALGQKISENDLKNFASQSGLVWKNLDQQGKAQVTINALIERTKDAYDDVNKSAGTYAHTQRMLSNLAKDQSESFGQKYLPALTEMEIAFSNNVKEGGLFSKILDSVGEAIANVFDKITTAIKALEYLQARFSAKSDWELAAEAAKKYGVEGGKVLKMVQESRESDLELRLKINEISGKAESKESKEIRAALKAKKQLILQRNAEVKSLQEYMKYTKLSTGLEKRQQKAQAEAAKKQTVTRRTVAPVSDEAKKEAERIRKRAEMMIAHYEKIGKEGVDKVNFWQEQELKKVEEFANKKVITKKEEQNLISKIEEEGAKRRQEIREQELKDSIDKSIQVVNAIGSGVTNILSAQQSLVQANQAKRTQMLEDEKAEELERLGLAEETEVEKAQAELKAAKAKGKKEEIIEAEKALKIAKINEKYDKEKAELDYNANLRAWELQKSMAKISVVTGVLNAIKSSWGAPWPLNMILPPINAATALAAGNYQLQTIEKSKPVKPKFAIGGIVPGNVREGDRIDAKLNSGEMVLNELQQKTLFDIANNKNAVENKPIMIHNVIELEGNVLYDVLTEASKDNRFKISDKSIVRY